MWKEAIQFVMGRMVSLVESDDPMNDGNLTVTFMGGGQAKINSTTDEYLVIRHVEQVLRDCSEKTCEAYIDEHIYPYRN